MTTVESVAIRTDSRAKALVKHPSLRAFLRAPSGIFSLVAILLLLIVAIVAPIFLTDKGEELHLDDVFAGPSWAHPLGTDQLGRDVLTRVLVATRLSLELGLAAAGVSIIIGLILGMMVVAIPPIRTVLTRAIDALISFPHLLIAIVLSVIIGVGAVGAIIGIGVAYAFTFARLTSSLALGIGGREYVNAARVIGVPRRRIVMRYVLPNIAEALFIAMFVKVSYSIIAVSGLSFLGLGVQSPSYDWGRMLTEGLKAIYIQPAGTFGPAGAIAFAALAFGFLGEALARASNPKLWHVEGPRQAMAIADGNIVIEPDLVTAEELTTASLPAAIPEPAPNGVNGHEDKAGGHSEPERERIGAVSESDRLERSNGSNGSNGGASRHDSDLAIRVRDLVVTYPFGSGRTPVVKGVSFDVAKGEIVGIVGESGSGKTQTALAVAQLTRYPGEVDGSIELDGEDLSAMSRRQLSKYLASKLAVIFQDPSASLNPALRIGPQMTMGTRVHRHMLRRRASGLAAERLREVHISAPERQLEKHPHELSGGMQQRVMIATGLMAEPTVLIADEPTTALDVTVQAQIMDLINEINTQRHAAILFISHNLALVSQNCHRVLVMYAGRIVEDITTTQLVEHGPQHPYTRALLEAIPRLDHQRGEPFASIPGETPNIAEPPDGCPYHPRCPLAVDRCMTERPALLTRSEGEHVACHVANADLLLNA